MDEVYNNYLASKNVEKLVDYKTRKILERWIILNVNNNLSMYGDVNKHSEQDDIFLNEYRELFGSDGRALLQKIKRVGNEKVVSKIQIREKRILRIPNYVNKENGYTMLHYNILIGSLETLINYMELKDRANINDVDNDGRNAAELGIILGNRYEMVSYLINKGSRIGDKVVELVYVDNNMFNENIPLKSLFDYLLIDKMSVSYITKQQQWKQTRQILLENIPNIENMTVTDLTSGVGVDVINFSKLVKFVNAVEYDKMRYYFMINNVNIYQLSNISMFNDDLMNIKDNLTQDIVYLDPKLHKNILINIEDLSTQLLDQNKAEYVIVKLPSNFYLKEDRISKLVYKMWDINISKKIYYNLYLFTNKFRYNYRYYSVNDFDIVFHNKHIRQANKIVISDKKPIRDITLNKIPTEFVKYKTTVSDEDRSLKLMLVEFLDEYGHLSGDIVTYNYSASEDIMKLFPNHRFYDKDNMVRNSLLFSTVDIAEDIVRDMKPKMCVFKLQFYDNNIYEFFKGRLIMPIWNNGKYVFLITDTKEKDLYSQSKIEQTLQYYDTNERVYYYNFIIPTHLEGYDHCADCTRAIDILEKHPGLDMTTLN